MDKNKIIKQILKEQLVLISPTCEQMKLLNNDLNLIKKKLLESIKKNKIKANIFVGGSYAKGTLIKKDKYDIDLFVRFDKKYDNKELSNLLEKIIGNNFKAERIHGSRDYFVLKRDNIEFEIIPVASIKKPTEARNITDLSYFHVNYVNKKIKANRKLADEIKLTKAFTHFAECYGAESYINGFSGYAVELLIIHYKSLVNFIKAILKTKDRIVIDDNKYYKNSKEILIMMNEAKLHSPIILVDPTFKQRNALSALSSSTFDSFKKFASDFLAKPSCDFFVVKDKEREFMDRYSKDCISLKIYTNKQAGDIAGTKLKKFYNFFIKHIARFFDFKDSLFIYDEKNNFGKILLVAKEKKEIIFQGPPVTMKEQLARFKLEHKKVEVKDGMTFAREKSTSFNEWFNDFKTSEERLLDSMDISEINILD
jgi:tRNA nucleotidyltransferase (CCA-adding enzyme)